jgi:hypothetical protein
VAAAAHEYGMPVHVRVWGAELAGAPAPAPTEVVRSSSSFQDDARSWRRRECRSILNDTGGTAVNARSGVSGAGRGEAAFIATAHHLDDQTETLLLKVLRGAHLSNLSFMKRKGAACITAIVTAITATNAPPQMHRNSPDPH